MYKKMNEKEIEDLRFNQIVKKSDTIEYKFENIEE